MKNKPLSLADALLQTGVAKDLSLIVVELASVAADLRALLVEVGFDEVGVGANRNVHGEVQLPLDMKANAAIKAALSKLASVAAVLSEEEEKPYLCAEKEGAYIVAVDPLDGSSNAGLGIPVGTIFSILKRQSPAGAQLNENDYHQKGSEQLLAGYFLYGSATTLVYAHAASAWGFVYAPEAAQFQRAREEKLSFPTQGQWYSINESLAFSSTLRHYLSTKRGQWGARYIGSLVADFHRNLLRGGLFAYPSIPSHKQGKLRLLYECNPLAFVARAAGGHAVDEAGHAILDLAPTHIHARVPFYVGGQDQIADWLRYLRQAR